MGPSDQFCFYSWCKYGFGFDSKTDDYKIAMMSNYRRRPQISVYSLKLNLWKTFEDIPFRVASRDLVLYEGIFCWVESSPRYSQQPSRVASFDIGRETFKEIPQPQDFSKFVWIFLCFLGDRLYIIGSQSGMTCSEVWMMKDYGVHEPWTKMFTIREPSGDLVRFEYLNLKQSFKNDVILVQVDDESSYFYDLKRKSFRELKFNDCGDFDTWAFMGSLVSPNYVSTNLKKVSRVYAYTANGWCPTDNIRA